MVRVLSNSLLDEFSDSIPELLEKRIQLGELQFNNESHLTDRSIS